MCSPDIPWQLATSRVFCLLQDEISFSHCIHYQPMTQFYYLQILYKSLNSPQYIYTYKYTVFLYIFNFLWRENERGNSLSLWNLILDWPSVGMLGEYSHKPIYLICSWNLMVYWPSVRIWQTQCLPSHQSCHIWHLQSKCLCNSLTLDPKSWRKDFQGIFSTGWKISPWWPRQ